MSGISGRAVFILLMAAGVLIVVITAAITLPGDDAGPIARGRPETWEPAVRRQVADRRHLALDHFHTGKYAEARAILTELAKRYPDDAETRSALAQVLYAQHNVPGAYEQITQALALDSRKANDHQFAGELAMMLDQPEAARAHYAAAMKLAPGAAQHALRLANAHLRLGDPDAARMLALRTLKLNPSVHQAHAMLAEIAARRNKLPMAVDQMDKAIAAADQDQTVRLYTLQKARYLRRDNQPQRALAVLEAMGRAAMIDDAVIEELAQTHLQLNQPRAAARLWAARLARDPGHVAAAAEAGLCFDRAGDRRNARHYLALAQRLNPDHPQVQALATALRGE